MKEFINKIKNNKTILAIIIAVLLITITGTFAWLSWKSKETALVLKVGDINGTIVTLKPYQLEGTLSPVQSYTDGLYTDVNITNNSTSNVYNVKLYYNISAIDDALKSEDFKYTILNTATNETTEGNFLNATTTDKFIIFDKDITPKDISNYKIYIWISGEGDTTSLQGKSFKAELRADIVFNKESSTKNIVVDVPEGMIPIVFDTSNGTVVKTVSSSDSSWYDYSNQEWANAVLVKENGTQTRAYYKANSGVEVNQADILAYYVCNSILQNAIFKSTIYKHSIFQRNCSPNGHVLFYVFIILCFRRTDDRDKLPSNKTNRSQSKTNTTIVTMCFIPHA